jgi:hypothetical protein
MVSSPLAVAIGIAPKCLTAARNAWVTAREQELLPVGCQTRYTRERIVSVHAAPS